VTQEVRRSPQGGPTGPATPSAPATPDEPTAPGARDGYGTEPELTGVRNFRDVGGLPAADGRRVRPGVLFRSGHLAHADEHDAAFLAGLGLHTVFDFRNRDDIALEGPDTDLPGTRNLNLPLSDPAEGAGFWHIVRDGDVPALREILGDGKAAERMSGAYRKLILERTGEHGRMLALLSEEQDPAVPALLHCAAGKDRAGTSIAIILLALGVERPAIEADYLESNARHRRYKVVRGDGSTGTAIDPEVRELLSPLFEARVEYLRTAFDTIEERWGTVDRYLEEGLGLTPERRERLKERLLTR
jgi:protein-tyrosine phosphatase